MQPETTPDKPPTDKPHSDQAPMRVLATDATQGERVDRFLAASAVGTLSRSRVKSLIEDGRVSRDGITIREPASSVEPGALYELHLPEPVPATPRPEAIPLAILYEDEHLLVLDKPPGLVTHPAPGNEEGTLVNAILAHCGDTLPGIGGERRPGIVHRLDKDTSGVMVVAKTEPALAALSADFADRRALERTYLALVWGLTDAAGTWTGAIGRDPRDRKRMAIVPRGGKHAVTHYERAAAHATALTLLRCRLETGRTHQIRVHAAGHGHPIVGDPVYLRRPPHDARALPPGLRALALAFPRQALHAAILGFRHPATGAPLRFETAPPADLRGLLDAIGLHAAPHNP